MQYEDSFTASIAHLIERAVRCERKTGEGKVPTQTIASILVLPDEPIFSETGVEGIATRISPNPLQSDWQLWKIQGMSIRVEFPTPAHLHSFDATHTCHRGKLIHRSSTLNETTFSV